MHQGPGRLLHEKAQRSPKTPWSGVSRIFSYGWTAEVATCVFALLALAGLAVVLSRFEDRPLPDWPKLVTVNSIISIFALLIRASVGLVLAEGVSGHSHFVSSMASHAHRHQPVEVAMVSKTKTARGYGALRRRESQRLGLVFVVV
jgi:hypothetical protein